MAHLKTLLYDSINMTTKMEHLTKIFFFPSERIFQIDSPQSERDDGLNDDVVDV